MDFTPCDKCRRPLKERCCPVCHYDPEGRLRAVKVFAFLVVPMACLAAGLNAVNTGTPGGRSFAAELYQLVSVIYLCATAFATVWTFVLWRRGRR